MGENFCLKWNDYDRNLSSTFCELREDKELLDITLTCDDDKQVRAHKVILSACSPFFRSILRRNPHEHPLLYLRGVRYKELEAILHFVYNGEVNVGQDELNEFLLVAEDLKIKGLTQSNTIQEPQYHQQVPKSKKETKPNIPNIISIASLKRNNESLSVPGATKRPKLSTSSLLSDNNTNMDSIKSSYNSESDIIVPSASSTSVSLITASSAGGGHCGLDNQEEEEEDIADLGGEPETEAYDESSIIEESYEGEDGEYSAELASSSEGYVGGVGGGGVTEDYDHIELTESSYTASNSTGGGTESTSGPKRNCPVCDKSIHKSSLKRHIRTVHTENFNIQCPDCHKKFKNLESLDSHRRLTHRINVSAAATAAAAAAAHHHAVSNTAVNMESLSQRLLEGFLKPAFGIHQD